MDYIVATSSLGVGMFVIYLTLFILFKPAISGARAISRINFNIGIVLILIACVFCAQNGDYLHYLAGLQNNSEHFEYIYHIIFKFIGRNYTLFRFVVWGWALASYLITIRRFELDKYTVLLFFVTMFLSTFAYARVALAMTLGLLGYSFFVRPIKNKAYSYIFGALLLVLSLQCHRSAVFMILVFFLSSFKINKYLITTVVLLLPFVYYYFESGLSQVYLDSSFIDTDHLKNYLTNDNEVQKTKLSVILNIIDKGIYYVILFIILKSIKTGLYHTLPIEHRSIINIVFYIIIITSVFLIDTSYNTSVIYYRLIHYANIPITFILCIYYRKKFCRRIIQIAFSTKFLIVLASLYSFYKVACASGL